MKHKKNKSCDENKSAWDSLLEWVKKHTKLSVLVVVLLVLLPILGTHIAFKISGPSWLAAEWSAGDILGYLGAIIGAAVTALAIGFTIMQFYKELKLRQSEKKLSIQPYFSSETKTVSASDVIEKNDKTICYVCYPYDSGDPEERISFQYEVPSDLESLMDMDRTIISESMFKQECCLYPFILYNVGSGNAINIRFRIDNQQPIPPFSIMVGRSKEFLFILNRSLLKAQQERKIDFQFEYNDIASMATYRQRQSIRFYIDDKEDLDFVNVRQDGNEVMTPPEEI